MIYETTLENMRWLIHQIGYIYKSQLYCFFEDAPDVFDVLSEEGTQFEFYFKTLITRRFIDFDPNTGIVSDHFAFKIKENELKQRLHSFWAIVDFSSGDVREITPIDYPGTYMLITHDNQAYDFTAVNILAEAQFAVRQRQANKIGNEPDPINHVAVVHSKEVGEKIQGYGFDSYCIMKKALRTVNEKEMVIWEPEYYTWD